MRGNKTIYGVYENNEEEECRFIGTVEEIAQEFKTPVGTIWSCASRNSKLLEKYLVVSLYKVREEEDI